MANIQIPRAFFDAMRAQGMNDAQIVAAFRATQTQRGDSCDAGGCGPTSTGSNMGGAQRDEYDPNKARAAGLPLLPQVVPCIYASAAF